MKIVISPGEVLPPVVYATLSHWLPPIAISIPQGNKYTPHQGSKEQRRRVKQLEKHAGKGEKG